MTTATHMGFWAWLAGAEAQTKTGPERKARPGPIFIHDAVQTWRGETLLLDILRRDGEEDAPR